jgi:hypothetical protein
LDLQTWRQRISLPDFGAAMAPAVGVTALCYGNGYSLITATVLGTATAAFGLWAVATER